ncbi:MAG TPA: hypothetical protein EYQ50_00625 [Verrucomicrobiales bacterium]|nr:hypothetical protein [Verrucomicrobiales bacterium]
MVVLFSTTLFLSAALLFWVQPLIAKMLLPLQGGSPAVWNTCMVFFQATLLAGYAYAHWSARIGSAGKQVLAHLAVLFTAFWFLPFSIPSWILLQLEKGIDPSIWLLLCLSLVVGVPFFVVSTTAPLLQRWFAGTRHPDADDPYFLYSAGNIGSLLALLGYPLFGEPLLRLQEQGRIWAFGYAALFVSIAACGTVFWRSSSLKSASGTFPSSVKKEHDLKPAISTEPVSWNRRARWIGFAFVPSSLMLGVTNFFATDIASIPLLWVVPLALYLSTFTLVFARRAWIPRNWMIRALPYGALALTFLLASKATEPVWLLILFHLLFFFVASMVCHARLADDRPTTAHLTEFYLWMSLGGVLGGIFNALLSPNLFNRVWEYPLMIIVACLLRPDTSKDENKSSLGILDFGRPILLGALTVGLAMGTAKWFPDSAPMRNLVTLGLPIILCFTMVERSLRFGLGLAAILIAGGLFLNQQGKPLFADRNFFGVSRVTVGQEGRIHQMFHGNTLHGRQFTDAQRRKEPLAYFHKNGPLGDIMRGINLDHGMDQVAVIGLGAGAMAAYAKPGQEWSYYEIDPLVIQLATDPQYFTFLSDSPPNAVNIIKGDARLQIQKAPDQEYDLIVLDAFSSDSIPVHLVTREAVALYRKKLTLNGWLAFHISNRYLNLEPIVAALAKDAGMHCLGWFDSDISEVAKKSGKDPSHWVVMATHLNNLAPLLSKGSGWTPVKEQKSFTVWTDDFSNILSVLRWK